MTETIFIHGEEWQLLPEGAIRMPDRNALVMADLHLGKAAHFRRNGIPLPPRADEANWLLLSRLLDRFPGSEVLFLGDLFHAQYNADWDNMSELTGHHSDCRFTLVLGNHDILPEERYREAGLGVAEQMELGPYLLTHMPMEEVPEGRYNLCGHLHPGVRLKGKGRQRLSVPCFFFAERQCILPAFGSFKGKYLLTPEKGNRVFALTGEDVIEVSANF